MKPARLVENFLRLAQFFGQAMNRFRRNLWRISLLDSFRAGFLYGLLKNESVETAAKMANAVAALKCREIGARTALPNRNELESLLKI